MQISSIGNIFINKTLPAKNYASAPLTFMGNPTGDSFEKSSSSNEGTLSQIKKDIVAQERLIEKLLVREPSSCRLILTKTRLSNVSVKC